MYNLFIHLCVMSGREDKCAEEKAQRFFHSRLGGNSTAGRKRRDEDGVAFCIEPLCEIFICARARNKLISLQFFTVNSLVNIHKPIFALLGLSTNSVWHKSITCADCFLLCVHTLFSFISTLCLRGIHAYTHPGEHLNLSNDAPRLSTVR
jgi:hypothetical protein